MKWLIGVDLRHGCEGALAFASWLRKHKPETDLVAMHAIEIPKGRIPVIPDLNTVSDYVDMFVHKHLPDAEVRLFEEQPAEDALARAVSVHQADALVIGRRSPRDRDTLIRLGAVARRLLRRLPSPIIVCPPDLKEGEIGKGPIVAAVQPDAAGASALAFARSVAAQTGRSITAVSVVQRAFPVGISYLPTAGYDGEARERTESEVRTWLATIPGGDAIDVMFPDDPVIPAIVDTAEELDASLLVCGSRLLSTVDRIVHTSIGSTLAGGARMPVAVVPPAS